MHPVLAFLSPVALLLPVAASDGGRAASGAETLGEARVTERASPVAPVGVGGPFAILREGYRVPIQRQVRIEQRVIIRISPSSAALREQMLAALPRRGATNTYEEQRLRGCIDIESIAAVQPAEENRLLLFMRDRRVLTAALERSCSAEDFYSGFYVEPSEDGQICARRDKLQSRSGANCSVAQFNRLVAVRD